MNFRFIIGLVVGYLAYRLVKKGIQAWKERQLAAQGPGNREPEELVQDPVCGTFIPRRDALKGQKDGQDYFFCSEGCLKRFRRGGPE
ncbi:MAG: YHS domain-containing protein [Deltaproteobacteria bacterium]|nr:MAG: YHS domain-containing protein [Deltaproteobacteria bacterium]